MLSVLTTALSSLGSALQNILEPLLIYFTAKKAGSKETELKYKEAICEEQKQVMDVVKKIDKVGNDTDTTKQGILNALKNKKF